MHFQTGFEIILRQLREMKDVVGTISNRRGRRRRRRRTLSHIAPDLSPCEFEPLEQGQWANLPPELLSDIITRIEETETSWPARNALVSCASVCNSWRDITKEIVMTPQQCGRLTFPISLKQPGPRDSPIQCFIKRDRTTSIYRLYLGLTPSEKGNDKLLLAARKIRRTTSTEFIISLRLLEDNFSRGATTINTTYNIGKLKSNFLGTKFAIYDTKLSSRSCEEGFHTKKPPSRLQHSYKTASVSYELNVLRTRGPRRMHCVLNSIPMTSIQEGGTAPTPTSLPATDDHDHDHDEKKHSSPLMLRNKSPRWHEQLQCWCLNFKGRVTVASVKNFQLSAAVDDSLVPLSEQEKVILQFGKIGKDIFTMDYYYPLSAFQAFAICLSSFDTKPACE